MIVSVYEMHCYSDLTALNNISLQHLTPKIYTVEISDDQWNYGVILELVCPCLDLLYYSIRSLWFEKAGDTFLLTVKGSRKCIVNASYKTQDEEAEEKKVEH